MKRKYKKFLKAAYINYDEDYCGCRSCVFTKPAVTTPIIVITGTTAIIACAISGATIYYTLDGSTPTSSSTEYTGTITLTLSCTIKAIAVKPGMSDSAVASESYVHYLTQWKIVGNSEVHGDEIWSCGEYNATDDKYHILVQPLGGSIVDIALNAPLRKVNDIADTIEFPSGTEGKALVTKKVEESGGELSPLDTPITELVDAPQIEEAESYSMVISQGGKAVSWSEFNGGILEFYDKIIPTDNAYIDTGYIPTKNSKFVAKVVTTSKAYCIYSNLRTQNDVDSTIRFFRSYNSIYIAFSGNRVGNQSSNHPTDIELEHSYTPKVTINNDSNTYTTSLGSKFASNTLYLFHDGYSSAYDYFNDNSLYSFKIYENDILVRDFKPCTYNGVAGLWDMVENKFYGNSNDIGTLTVSNDA